MRYTAGTLTAAARPVVLTIGRVSTRGWRRWVTRWWVRHCRTWEAKPLSVPQMLTLQAAGRDPIPYFVSLLPILRDVLPRRWWYRLVGDPVRLILRLPPELVQQVLKALVTVPGTDRDVSREPDDPIEAIRQAQRRSVYGEHAEPGLSLAVAALSVRAAYGDSWYYNPQRWPTSDGYVPFAVALVEHAGVQALEVRRRLEVADGFSLAHAQPHERQRMHRVAYPMEVC